MRGQRMRAFGHAISLSRRMTALRLLVLLSGVLPASASALTLEQARESCGASTMRPLVHACMQSFGKGGDHEANLARCRATAQPRNKACVEAALNKANGRANVAITVESGAKK